MLDGIKERDINLDLPKYPQQLFVMLLLIRFGQTTLEGGGIVKAIGSLKVTLGGLLDLGGSVSSRDGSLGLEDTSSNCFPLLRVMRLAFSLGFMMVGGEVFLTLAYLLGHLAHLVF